MAKMVQMMALSMATIAGSRGILHTDDRKEADLAARYPLVSEEDAALLERNKFAKRYDGTVPTEDGEGDLTVDEYAERETEDSSDAENSVDATTGLATRSTTAFEAPVDALATGDTGRSITADDGRSAPASPDDAPAGGGAKPLSKMTTAELTKVASDEQVDITSATNNAERADLIQKARDAKSQS